MKRKKHVSWAEQIGIGILLTIGISMVLTGALSLAIEKEWLPPKIMDVAAILVGMTAVFAGCYSAARPLPDKKMIAAVVVLAVWLIACAILRLALFRDAEFVLHKTLYLQAVSCVAAGLTAGRKKRRRRAAI